MDKIEKEKIYYRFINGTDIQSLADEYNMTWSAMYQIIGNRLPCSLELTHEVELSIVEKYQAGNSSTKIAEQYKISHKLVNKILDKYEVRRVHNGVRKWNLCETYFDKLDTQNKAYILGFLFADGYNDIGKSTIRLQLRWDDKDILTKINQELESDRPLKLINCSNRVALNGYISQDMYLLEVYSRHLCDTLASLGMVQNKSLVLRFPEFHDTSLYRHFIRGYFDGDGSFSRSTRYSNSIVTLTSTYDFCKRCLDIMQSELGIGGAIYDASCHNGVTKVLSVSGNVQCKKILDWLYDGATLYLQRKHDKYIQNYYPTLTQITAVA